MPHRRAGRDHPARRHQHARLVEIDPGIALAKQRRQPPRRRCRLLIEQTGFRQQERTDARSGDTGTVGMPRDKLFCRRPDVLPVERRNQPLRRAGRQGRHHDPVGFQVGCHGLDRNDQALAGTDLFPDADDGHLEQDRAAGLQAIKGVGQAEGVAHYRQPGIPQSVECQHRNTHGGNDIINGVYANTP